MFTYLVLIPFLTVVGQPADKNMFHFNHRFSLKITPLFVSAVWDTISLCYCISFGFTVNRARKPRV